MLPERTYSQAFDRFEAVRIVSINDQSADIVIIRVNQRLPKNLIERQVGKPAFSRYSLALGTSRNTGQLIPRLLFIRFREQFPKIRKDKSLLHQVHHRPKLPSEQPTIIATSRKDPLPPHRPPKRAFAFVGSTAGHSS